MFQNSHHVHNDFRLESYRRNDNFPNIPVVVPKAPIPNWPVTGFKQLQPEMSDHMPNLTMGFVNSYFQFRQQTADVKSILKGQGLYESARFIVCSCIQNESETYFSGVVKSSMKSKVFQSIFLEQNSCFGSQFIIPC